MLHAVLEAGAEFDLRPAGEKRFQRLDSRTFRGKVYTTPVARLDPIITRRRKRQCAAASSDFSEATGSARHEVKNYSHTANYFSVS
jgi:hypothetical protein